MTTKVTGNNATEERRNADAKKEILKRIRNAQQLSETPSHVEAIREYRTESDLSTEELREILIDRLVDYKATVVETSEENLAKDIAGILAERGATDIVYAPGMDASLFEAFEGEARADDPSSDPRELNDIGAAVTESKVTSAQTGTIVLEAGDACGRRSLSLVPDRHVVVVRPDSVVFGVPELVARLDPLKPNTMISGGSATSDIELVRVEGVHGPRDLIVMVVH